MVYNYAEKHSLLSTAYALIGLTSLFFIGRVGLQVWGRKYHPAEDALALTAYVLFLAVAILYIEAAPELYNEKDEDSNKPWHHAQSQPVREIFFGNTILFWSCLWSTKFMFLVLYRRYMAHTKVLLVLWWGVAVFFCLTLAGAIISNFFTCHSWHDLWTYNGCSSSKDIISQKASLFYSLSADVVLNLILITFALYLAWNLQFTLKSMIQQIGFCIIIIITLFCMSAAFFRAIVSRDATHPYNLPTSSWLALWTIIEASLAVIIACLPGLDVTNIHERPMPRAMTPIDYHHHARFDSRGFTKHSTMDSYPSPSDDIALSSVSNIDSVNANMNRDLMQSPGSYNRSRAWSSASDKLRHTPFKLPSTYGPTHKRSATDSMAIPAEIIKETTPTSHQDDIVPMSTPGVSRRASKASLRYTPIHIPGTIGHKRDKTGSLSGAFWSDMEGSERSRLEERAKEIKIQMQGSREVTTGYGNRDRDGYDSGLGFAV